MQDLGQHLHRDLPREAGQQPGRLLISSRQAPVQCRADVLEGPQPPPGGVHRGDGLHGGAAGGSNAPHPGPGQPASYQLPGRVLTNGRIQVNPASQFPQHVGSRPPIAAQAHFGGRSQGQQGPVGVDVPRHLADPAAGRVPQGQVQACRAGHSHHRGWRIFTSPHFSPGGAIMAQEFFPQRVLASEGRSGDYVRASMCALRGKGQARARPAQSVPASPVNGANLRY